jgi:hypothetical protein
MSSVRRILIILAVWSFAGRAAPATQAADPDGSREASSSASNPSYFALFELHRRSGRGTQAQAVLASLDRRLAPADVSRLDLAAAYV